MSGPGTTADGFLFAFSALLRTIAGGDAPRKQRRVAETRRLSPRDRHGAEVGSFALDLPGSNTRLKDVHKSSSLGADAL
jgi:hypothetical protein